jgi:hypothetical protein
MDAKFRFVFSHRRADAFEAFELADGLFGAGASSVKGLGEEARHLFLICLVQMTGMTPRFRAACRLALLA